MRQLPVCSLGVQNRVRSRYCEKSIGRESSSAPRKQFQDGGTPLTATADSLRGAEGSEHDYQQPIAELKAELKAETEAHTELCIARMSYRYGDS
jgi:hypothetical protein